VSAASLSLDSRSDEGVTRALARFIVESQAGSLPDEVRREAVRTFCNWVGCAVGGARHDAVGIAIAALQPFAGGPQATILGRSERLDALQAALVNGISSHVLDFDDTHLRTVIHPAGPVASALLALAEYRPVAGPEFVHALVIGVEAECRIGNAVFPAHYDRGWHITGTTGVFGAAAAAGKLLSLSESRMLWALGLAATQPVGLREMFGTMTKSFHPGRAAQNGLTAALLAAGGYTSSERALEAPRGWANVLSESRDYAEITEGLGARWEILLNSYKPFPCGIVIHPAIDACLQISRAHKLDPAAIDRIELRVHPLVLELTGKRTPQTGLETKFSVFHACAAAIVEGACGEKQFSDRAAQDPLIISVRDRVHAIADTAVPPDSVDVAVMLRDGNRLEEHISHAIGSRERPMTDDDLSRKFAEQAEGVLPNDRIQPLIDLCWRVESLDDVAELARAAAL
jgi:2-methylcitrate dehydratase PrpD